MVQINYKSDFNIDFYAVLPQIEGGSETATRGASQQYKLYPSDVIHHYIGKYDLSQQGLSVLKPIWSALIRYAEIEESMASYDSRIGRGVLVISVDVNEYSDSDIKSLSNAVETINNRGFLMLKHGQKGPAQFQWASSSSNVNFTEDMYMLLKGIASASGFPVRFLIGDPKGALSAADVDKKAIWENLKSIFGEYVSFIRNLIIKQENGEELNEEISEILFDDGGNLMDEQPEEKDRTEKDLMLTREIE